MDSRTAIILLLNQGNSVFHSYKENREDWIEDASIGTLVTKDYFVNVVGEYKRTKDINDAVDFFMSKAYNSKNLMYKFKEALNSVGMDDDFDFRNDDEFNKVNKVRLKLIEHESSKR